MAETIAAAIRRSTVFGTHQRLRASTNRSICPRFSSSQSTPMPIARSNRMSALAAGRRRARPRGRGSARRSARRSCSPSAGWRKSCRSWSSSDRIRPGSAPATSPAIIGGWPAPPARRRSAAPTWPSASFRSRISSVRKFRSMKRPRVRAIRSSLFGMMAVWGSAGPSGRREQGGHREPVGDAADDPGLGARRAAAAWRSRAPRSRCVPTKTHSHRGQQPGREPAVAPQTAARRLLRPAGRRRAGRRTRRAAAAGRGHVLGLPSRNDARIRRPDSLASIATVMPSPVPAPPLSKA